MSQGVSPRDVAGTTFSSLSQGSGYALERPQASVHPAGFLDGSKSRTPISVKVRGPGQGSVPGLPCQSSATITLCGFMQVAWSTRPSCPSVKWGPAGRGRALGCGRPTLVHEPRSPGHPGSPTLLRSAPSPGPLHPSGLLQAQGGCVSRLVPRGSPRSARDKPMHSCPR